MIALYKPNNPPSVLIKNGEKWKKDLIDAIEFYGSYTKIPKEKREKLLVHYRDKELTGALFSLSFNKCAFCETQPGESGNIEVEHFKPKSLYPELTFKWDNLLPVCRKCNEAKGSLDTEITPIVNPFEDDPDNYFDYDYLFMIPSISSLNFEIADRTIKVLKLNSTRLFKARGSLLANLSSFIIQLENWLEEIENSETEKKRDNRIVKLKDSLDIIEDLISSDEKYTAFTKTFLKKNTTYLKAKSIIKHRVED